MESPLRLTRKEPHLEFLFPNVGSLDSSCPTLERKDTPKGDWVYVSHHLCMHATAPTSGLWSLALGKLGEPSLRKTVQDYEYTRRCGSDCLFRTRAEITTNDKISTVDCIRFLWLP